MRPGDPEILKNAIRGTSIFPRTAVQITLELICNMLAQISSESPKVKDFRRIVEGPLEKKPFF